MIPVELLYCFGGGVFLGNSVPHLAAGTMGRPFQSPFANPRGEGYSSSTLNVVWALMNLAGGYLLLVFAGHFNPSSVAHAASAFGGVALISLYVAARFGRFNGGDRPLEAQRRGEARRAGNKRGPA